MSGFFSANVTPAGDPNILFKAQAAGDAQYTNQLLNQGRQMDLTAADHEQVARLSAALLNEPDLAKRGDLYARGVGMLQSQNLARYAPASLPDESTLRMLASQGTPSEKLLQHQQDIATNNAILGDRGGGTGTGTTATPAGRGGPAPFVGANLPAGVSADEDQLVRTVYGEAGGEPVAGQQAVAHVIKTRMKLGNQGVGDVVFAPNQFEAWSDPKNRPRMEALDPASPQYQSILNKVVRPVLSGQATDPTGGATNFYNPALQAQLGRSTPGFAQGNRTTIGNHEFYYGGYAPRAATASASPPPAPAGGAGTPGSYQVASTAPTAPPGSTAAPGPSTTEPQFTYPNGKVGGAPDAQGGVHYADGNYGTPPPGRPLPVATATPPPPATTAATPPAATPAPAPYIAPLPPPPVFEANGFKPEQNHVLDRLRSTATPDKILALQNSFRDDNRADITAYNARVDKHHADVRQADQDARQARQDAQALQDKAQAAANAAENLRLSQESGQRDAARLKLSESAEQRATDDAAQKAKLANKPVQGTDVDAQHESYLYEHADEIRDGSASKEVQRQYAGSYYALQQKGGQATTMTDPNNPGSQIPAMITRRLPTSLPEPPGGALPLVMSSPGAAKQDQMTVEQGKAGAYAARMTLTAPIMEALDEKALTWAQSAKEKAGNFIGYNLNSTDYKNLRVAQEAFLSGVIRQDSGAAVGQDEWTRYAHVYFPMPGDTAETVALKRHLRDIELQNMKREAGPNWKPPENLTTGNNKNATSDKRKPLSAFD